MAILSTIVKDFIRYKKEGGYITLKPKTDADCVTYINSDAVETNVQTELDELNNNLSNTVKGNLKRLIMNQVYTGDGYFKLNLDSNKIVIGVVNARGYILVPFINQYEWYASPRTGDDSIVRGTTLDQIYVFYLDNLSFE